MSTESEKSNPKAPDAAGEDSVPADTSAFEDDPFLENPALRGLGLMGRVGRLLGLAFAKGSRYLAYSSDVGEAFRPVVRFHLSLSCDELTSLITHLCSRLTRATFALVTLFRGHMFLPMLAFK